MPSRRPKCRLLEGRVVEHQRQRLGRGEARDGEAVGRGVPGGVKGEGEGEGEEERRGRGAVEVHSKERMEKGWMSLYCPLNGVGREEGR